MVSIQKKVLKTFFRSVIQATESTLMGCIAKSIPTKALLQNAPVIHLKTINSKGGHNENQTHQYITVFDDKFFATIICSGHGKITGFWRVVLFQMFYGWLLSNQDIVVKLSWIIIYENMPHPLMQILENKLYAFSKFCQWKTGGKLLSSLCFKFIL